MISRILLLLFILPSYVFASEQIDFEVSSETIQIDEAVTLRITLSTGSDSDGGEISIEGMQNFDIISQGQSSNVKIINGNVSSEVSYTVALSAKNAGIFSLGPITLSLADQEIIDDVVYTIRVQDPFSPLSEDTEEETLNTQMDTTLNNNKTQREDDIRGLRTVGYPYMFLLFCILSFGIIFFIMLKKILSLKEQRENTGNFILQTEETIEQKDPDQQKRYFKHLSQVLERLSEKEFYLRFNAGVRNILSERGVDLAQSSTLLELSKKLKNNYPDIWRIFSESYLLEYQAANDPDYSKRKELIDKILRELEG